MDPHPAVGQQRPALRLHPVGDQLPRPARYRRLHPGRLLEEDQRAGNAQSASSHHDFVMIGVVSSNPVSLNKREREQKINESICYSAYCDRKSLKRSWRNNVLQKLFPQTHLEFPGLSVCSHSSSHLPVLFVSHGLQVPTTLPEAAADFIPSCRSLLFRVVCCFPSPSCLLRLDTQNLFFFSFVSAWVRTEMQILGEQ